MWNRKHRYFRNNLIPQTPKWEVFPLFLPYMYFISWATVNNFYNPSLITRTEKYKRDRDSEIRTRVHRETECQLYAKGITLVVITLPKENCLWKWVEWNRVWFHFHDYDINSAITTQVVFARSRKERICMQSIQAEDIDETSFKVEVRRRTSSYVTRILPLT